MFCDFWTGRCHFAAVGKQGRHHYMVQRRPLPLAAFSGEGERPECYQGPHPKNPRVERGCFLTSGRLADPRSQSVAGVCHYNAQRHPSCPRPRLPAKERSAESPRGRKPKNLPCARGYFSDPGAARRPLFLRLGSPGADILCPSGALRSPGRVCRRKRVAKGGPPRRDAMQDGRP